MKVVAAVVAVLLALATVSSAVPKLRLRGEPWPMLRNRGYKANTVRAIGGAEIVGVVLLLVGIVVPVVGIVGAVLVLGLLLWALVFHIQYGDYGNPDARKPALVPLGSIPFAIAALLLFVSV